MCKKIILLLIFFSFNCYADSVETLLKSCPNFNETYEKTRTELEKRSITQIYREGGIELSTLLLYHPDLVKDDTLFSQWALICWSYLKDFQMSGSKEGLEKWKNCVKTSNSSIPTNELNLLLNCPK